MKKTVWIAAFLLLASTVTGPALADELYVFPSQGQSQEQTEQDKSACYRWARSQTGFDPMAVPAATAPPPPQKKATAGPLAGAAFGAVGGAIIGEIASDDPGKGAAIGAVTGALFGGMRRRGQAQKQKQAEQQWAQEQSAQYAQRRNTYNRAYAACLEGKGYTVK